MYRFTYALAKNYENFVMNHAYAYEKRFIKIQEKKNDIKSIEVKSIYLFYAMIHSAIFS